MAEYERPDELSHLLHTARRAEPPALTTARTRHMLNVAIQSAELQKPQRTRRVLYAGALAAAVLLGLAGQSLRSAGPRPDVTLVEVAPEGLPLRLSLRTGDALVLTPSAKLEVLTESAPVRKLRLKRGTVLFNVTPLTQGQHFEVETEQANVRVRGTVFSVRVEKQRTTVHVYEGSVDVDGRLLRAGEHWASNGRAAAAPEELAGEVRTALASRAARVHTEALPFTTPVAEATAGEPSAAPQSPVRPDPVRATEAVVQPAVAPKAVEPISVHTAEYLLRHGQADTVLMLLRDRRNDPHYARVIADALRALGDFAQATAAYEALATNNRGSAREQAAFAAAQLAATSLNAPGRTLALIDRFALDADQSVLRERASVLRIDALKALGRTEEAQRAIERYLAREPETGTSVRLRGLLEPWK